MKGDHIQASVPAPVASLPPRQPIPSVHFSMAGSVHLSMAIDTRPFRGPESMIMDSPRSKEEKKPCRDD